MPIRAPKDFWIGVLYLFAGIVGWIMARDYPFGSASRMGPGFFPTIVSLILVIIGFASIVRGYLLVGNPVGHMPWRALGLIAGSSVAFGLIVRPVGFIVASAVLILMSAAASSHFRLSWRSMVGLVLLIAVSAAVFVQGLGMPLPLVGKVIKDILPFGMAS